MTEDDIPEDFDNTPIVGPTVNAFIDLLAKIASRSLQEQKEENT